jgi:hypothetical protein
MWKNKYEALAKLYSQLRKEHIDLLNKYKQLQVKANSANEATEKLERIQADMRAKNIELADLIRERDRARNELARLQGVSFTYHFNPCLKMTNHYFRTKKAIWNVYVVNWRMQDRRFKTWVDPRAMKSAPSWPVSTKKRLIWKPV